MRNDELTVDSVSSDNYLIAFSVLTFSASACSLAVCSTDSDEHRFRQLFSEGFNK